jgi:predicted Zn-dependent protease
VGSEAGGVLLFGKKQELEAHRYVLIFAAIAGYDPN